MQRLLNWAKDVLPSANDIQHDIVVETPWSLVLKIHTKNNSYYLKKTPSALYKEVKILDFLNQHQCVNIPLLIARNNELNCFIISDVWNETIRDSFKKI